MSNQQNEAVLITGCSSGIGHASALYLARQGLTVFASVRKEADAEALRGLNEPNLVPVCPLDLTMHEHIPPILETVKRESESRGIAGLRALVHNAGGGGVAPVELLDLDAFSRELDTRLVGSVALVQAFLPLIRRTDSGRIVWITTPSIIPTPYVASIHAADFAVNCLARTLSIELKPWGIPNVMIRCGGIQTPAAERTYDDLWINLKSCPQDKADLYRKALQEWADSMVDFDAKRTAPEKVAEIVHKAISAAKPRPRYSVGHMAGAAAFLEALPQTLGDTILSMRF
ncbi:MAG: SDR family NAD(P)-dependent oxidoreductase [Anaerolineae bacterium]|nr:SDR family NAD(P)-dependent oxidoreductase [Anaerolineae bacterium]